MNYFSLLRRQFPLLETIWAIFDVLEISTLLRLGAIGLKVDACLLLKFDGELKENCEETF